MSNKSANRFVTSFRVPLAVTNNSHSSYYNVSSWFEVPYTYPKEECGGSRPVGPTTSLMGNSMLMSTLKANSSFTTGRHHESNLTPSRRRAGTLFLQVAPPYYPQSTYSTTMRIACQHTKPTFPSQPQKVPLKKTPPNSALFHNTR